MTKLTIIGGGNLGGQVAFHAAANKIADKIVLIDIVEGLAAGKALDIKQAMPIIAEDINIIGGTDYALCKSSDVIIITAGIARRPGMTREDLLKTNAQIMMSIIPHIKEHAPQAKLIIVSNPVDAMVYLAYRLSGFEKEKVIGMAGLLDTARFKTFIAEELNAHVKEVDAMVLGSHGDLMVPLISKATVKGRPLKDIMQKDRIDAIVERTRKGGEEIVRLLKTGSAYFAPACAAVEMADSVINNRFRVLPCLAYLDGEYGVKGLFAGVPVELSRKGAVVQCMELDCDEEEQFSESIRHIQKVVESLNKIII